MIKLFDNIERKYSGPSRLNEKQYSFYNRSAQMRMGIIRERLNDWFESLPDQEKPSMKNRFKKEFNAAFYELFLFQLFKHLGFSIEIHPELNDTLNKPDFLIQRDGIEIYVEAKVCNDKSNEEEGYDRFKNEFYDAVNKLKIRDFTLWVKSVEFKTEKQPKVNKLIAHLRTSLNNLDADLLLASLEKDGSKALHTIEFEEDNFNIIIQPLPVTKEGRENNEKRAIGAFPHFSFEGGGEDALRSDIKYKAKRYGQMDKPFLICINALSERITSFTDIEDSIWGTQVLRYTDNPNDDTVRLGRKKDGVFHSDDGPLLTNLSGVLISRVSPFNIPFSEYLIYEHPFTENRLDFNKLGLIYNSIQENLINKTGNDLDTVFGIPKDWLKEK